MDVPRARRTLWCAVAAGVLVACSGGGGTSSTTSAEPSAVTDPPVSTTIPTRVDGELTVGALLPLSGSGAVLGDTLLAGLRLAIAEINSGGRDEGVYGQRVRLVIQDEGSSATSARVAVAELLDAGADVVVGPASSRLALSALGPLVSAGIPTCSPTATAISLSRYPDDGYFFRTIPSDELQASALALLVERTGLSASSVVFVDDEFGVEYADVLVDKLQARNITVTARAPYERSDTELVNTAVRALSTQSDAVVLVGDPIDGPRMLAELRSLLGEDAAVFVNDALRLPTLAGALGTRAESFLSRIRGASPRSDPVSTEFAEAYARVNTLVTADFAAYAYDCVMLLGLAAAASPADDMGSLADQVVEVSRGGSPCTTFAGCRELIERGFQVNYNGASGPVDLDANGDPANGQFYEFGFDPEGKDVSLPTPISV